MAIEHIQRGFVLLFLISILIILALAKTSLGRCGTNSSLREKPSKDVKLQISMRRVVEAEIVCNNLW